MPDFRADLHCHSNCSDGSFSPQELLLHAKKQNLQGLCITDHDSIDAYPIALPYAKEIGMDLISGAEFSAVYEGVSVHILGYSFELNNEALKEFIARHHQRRQDRNRAILERLKANRMPITEEEVYISSHSVIPSEKKTIGRPHIAQAMIRKGYVSTIQEAFKLYLGEDKSCFVRGDALSVSDTINVIHQAKGFAVIAHPHLIKETHIIPKLLQFNFDGLEGYYARLSAEQNQRWVKIAARKNWLITGGSDFHGDIKPSIDLGDAWVNEETFQILKNRFHENA